MHMSIRRREIVVTGMLWSGGGGPSAKIYGVSWDKSATVTLTRTDDAAGMTAAAGVGAGTVTNDFDTAEIYSEITEVEDALGNKFVRIPKFYIKKTDGVDYKTWQISKRYFAGAYLPWCFYNFSTGGSYAYVDVGKYPASLSGANKLESKADVFPLVDKNIVEFRGYAQANGAGYQQLDIHVYDMLQVLFLVEFATLDSQSVMYGWANGVSDKLATVEESSVNRIIVANADAALFATGQPIGIGTSNYGNQIASNRIITSIDVYDASNKAISFDGDAVNIAVGNYLYNLGWKNGFSSGIAATSGSLTSNSDGKNPMVYRGIENLYGNIWQFVDGVNVNDNQGWVCKNPASYTSNVFASPYKQLGYVNKNANNYVKFMGFDSDLPFAEFPTDVSTNYYKDYYYQSAGQRIAFGGGGWYYGGRAGLFCWHLNFSSAGTDVGVGGRLLKKAL